MVTLNPVPRALVPVDSVAAETLSSPNYDEFQSDREIYDLLQRQPHSVLRITMPHTAAESPDAMLPDGSPEALQAAALRMAGLRSSRLTREVADILFLYEIASSEQPGKRQVGLGGMARAGDILTEQTPNGVIIRNEGVRPGKARGRADLIESTNAIIGMVNLVVEDTAGALAEALQSCADQNSPDYHVTPGDGFTHRIWLLGGSPERSGLVEVLRADPFAYVADGNHRSAAAAMLGLEGFLATVFPASQLGLAPYNRLVRDVFRPLASWKTALEAAFEVSPAPPGRDYQPGGTHEIGLYAGGTWLRLKPKAGSFDGSDASQSIDASIVQRQIFGPIAGIEDPRDERLVFVGGNRDARYLRDRVDAGEFDLAVTLPPVTMEQFVNVCRQRRMMPPKSTWFSPKVRSGLVMALLD